MAYRMRKPGSCRDLAKKPGVSKSQAAKLKREGRLAELYSKPHLRTPAPAPPTLSKESMKNKPNTAVEPPVEKQKHRFTLEKVEKNKERLEAIKRAIGCGLTVRAICEIFRVSPHTVGLVGKREPELVAAGKNRLAGKFNYGAHLALESAIEAIVEGTMPPASLPVAAGIFTDKSLKLGGEATAMDGMAEHRTLVDPTELAKRAKAALSKQAVVDVKVKPDEPPIDV